MDGSARLLRFRIGYASYPVKSHTDGTTRMTADNAGRGSAMGLAGFIGDVWDGLQSSASGSHYVDYKIRS
jgi:hypothetical protein